MNNPLRTLWFSHYWWITLAATALVCMVVFAWVPVEHRGQSLVALLATALSVVYFVQKQKLEELEVFERLFTQFNERYDNRFHPELRKCPIQEEILSSYFNLCAEEFLAYSEGLIHPMAWRAWCRGMQHYLKNQHVEDYFVNQVKPETHYGLSRAAIDSGASYVRWRHTDGLSELLKQVRSALSRPV